ncbi:hypothetical protein GDO81_016317 [Engystomops pustulosus]|uniref:MIT domain-containing protein n=1 Tax=Engystomops pustulosus TaxID=76066 RepID=A0AAV7AR91_ENGPU|nr:hypothetical protein GDO81_016317 [Engystomops pustulosus]
MYVCTVLSIISCTVVNVDGASLETESSLNLLSLRCDGEQSTPDLSLEGDDGGLYLSQATAEVQRAMERESAGEYPEAFRLFRNAVDILLKGVKDDRCPDRRDAVRRRTSEYLHHAEQIFQDHMGGSTDSHCSTEDPGSGTK